MRENMFMNLSNKDLQDCYHSWIRVQIKRENAEEGEAFSSFVDEYIWALESNGTKYRHYDDNKKYNIGFSLAEKDMLHAMAKRYLKLSGLLSELKPFFGEYAE